MSQPTTKQQADQNSFVAFLKKKIRQAKAKRLARACSCSGVVYGQGAMRTLVALGLTEKQARNYLKLVDKEWAKVKAKTENSKVPAWKCSCGCLVPKRGVVLAGGPSYSSGYHVHCPQCGRVVVVWVDPKETR